MNNYQGGTLMTTEEVTQLQIFISGRGLYDMDIFSKSDPYVKVSFKRAPNQPWAFLGRTETIDNNLNPNFKKSFIVDYIFQARQQLKFQVMDEDDKSNSQNDDFIGAVETTLGAMAGARDQTSILQLKNPQKQNNVGKIILRVQPCHNSKNNLRMKWKAVKLMNTDSWFDWWDKSDPYLKFLKIRKDNTLVQANRTAVIQNNLNPNWNQIDIPVGKLIREDNQEQKFKVECWDWETQGEPKHQFIGDVYLKLPDLLNAKLPLEIPLNNPKQTKPGTLVLEKVGLYQKPTFIDYLRGGMQLNMSVAIDFTGSNGIPTSPSSLHYINKFQPNQYQKAIMAIGNILLNYDSDKQIPAFGFGAKLKFPNMFNYSVSHCFPLSGNNQQIQAFGLDGLMNLYSKSLMSVELSSPTYFAPIINQFINLARQSHTEGANCYQVLLILTDGQIHDMDKTVDLIVANSHLPLSIIIVGVGSANFDNMNTLDGDNGLYNSQGVKATRDIVQFVPFNQVQMNPDLLARQLLAQLPDQITQYMGMMNKLPGKPNQVNISSMMMDANNMENIQSNLKANLPKLFEGLTILPTGIQNSKV